ncbi:MAG: hypothetical protein AAB787_02345 [Patescibacteria group bacterium]
MQVTADKRALRAEEDAQETAARRFKPKDQRNQGYSRFESDPEAGPRKVAKLVTKKGGKKKKEKGNKKSK